jgi:hypothetical protein
MCVLTRGATTDQSWVQHSEEIKRERYDILIDKLHILTMKFFSLKKQRTVRIWLLMQLALLNMMMS